jgi:NTE family protein
MEFNPNLNFLKKPDIRIGLALGGGTALGFAHIGVLQAFEDGGVPIDFISGTSAGAIIGSLYAFGVSFKDIEDEAKNLNWKKAAKIHPSKLGIATNDAVRKILEKHIGKKADIIDAKIPLAIVATDIESGAKIIFRSGNVVDAVLASSCLPGLFAPVQIQGMMLVDGGIVENVPVSPLKGMGADIIVGVNLLRYRKYLKPENIMGVLSNSFDMINHKISTQPRPDGAHILIEPDLSGYYMGDINKWQEIADCGYKETLEHIDTIKKLKKVAPVDTFWQNVKKLFSS